MNSGRNVGKRTDCLKEECIKRSISCHCERRGTTQEAKPIIDYQLIDSGERPRNSSLRANVVSTWFKT
jgi:hypothetical protein